ncbi:MAG: 1-deoxy-D-xylulose-5-phosphate reductoisomerase [Candidatus Eremiobacteraeota bacterium]|nr:1-deoxy-D-xylulose-5-phosphate reductoisomerase [Candidatus Eremiobacteraeota bacterium]
MSARKRIAILGSTGSIGTQALDVIARHPARFEVVALAAGRNVSLLRDQAARFLPRIATTSADGPAGLMRVAVESEADLLLAATDGAVGFEAVFAAVERGTTVAVANEELIVAAGDLLAGAARRGGCTLLPVDSEHSAIFQCLVGEHRASIDEIVLTASGGPFWRVTKPEMEHATVEEALAHPTWRMGVKNTIDSATMMNKGLEVIEASRLFGVPGERVRIVVHPQSIAHGFVRFTDGSVKAQLAAPDMRVPIGYALAYPQRLPSSPDGAAQPGIRPVLEELGAKPGAAMLRYDFEPPDTERFPCIRLAYQALGAGGALPAALSAANEVAVDAFVEGKIAFGEISRIIEQTLDGARAQEPTLDGIRAADQEARTTARRLIAEIERPTRC